MSGAEKSFWERPENKFREQIAATQTLIRFLQLHNQIVPEGLTKTLEALQAGDHQEAFRMAAYVRPHGMGSLTDGVPPPNEGEDHVYCDVVLNALVRHWCFWIAEMQHRNQPYWKRMICSLADNLRFR